MREILNRPAGYRARLKTLSEVPEEITKHIPKCMTKFMTGEVWGYVVLEFTGQTYLFLSDDGECRFLYPALCVDVQKSPRPDVRYLRIP